MEMHSNKKNILLVSMPFAGTVIPSIQLGLLSQYLKDKKINVDVKNLYLKASEMYGLRTYNNLIYNPNEPYTSQIVFSKYIFPDHWNENQEKIKKYFKQMKTNIDFENYVKLTDQFYEWITNKINYKKYNIIGFTLNYGQFLPSLSLSKYIKEKYPGKKIIFGGSRTIDTIGKNILKTFDFIDYICSGDGEQTLYELASNENKIENISNLIHRRNGKVIKNTKEYFSDLNNTPIPNYDTFFEEINLSSDEIKQYFNSYGKIPIEISRGCWWNKCTFCSQNTQHKKYREKDVDKIIDEIQYLSNKYKILDFQLIGDTLPKEDYRFLINRIIKLNKDFSFFVETRAGRLTSNDYHLLKKAGFNIIQTGIETFSNNYIKKMKKGQNIIDNIAALKYCKENNITNQYNIIVNYPNEEKVDFEETQKNINQISQYIPPPQISYLTIEYGSYIYNNIGEFNIAKLKHTNIDKMMFPEDILKQDISCIFNYETKNEKENNNWEELVKKWNNYYKSHEIDAYKTKSTIDKLIFYYTDGGGFLKIYDKRNYTNVQIYVLNNIEREIFLSCIDKITFEKIIDKLSHIPEDKIKETLQSFENYGLIFKENNNFLALPLRYKYKKTQTKEIEENNKLLQLV